MGNLRQPQAQNRSLFRLHSTLVLFGTIPDAILKRLTVPAAD